MNVSLTKGVQKIIRTMPLVEALIACGGFYECPKGENGIRLGPLVGYAGRDKNGRQFVGDVYINIAALEAYPHVLWSLSRDLNEKLSSCNSNHTLTDCVFCGAPLGGIVLASMMAGHVCARFVYPEKEVLELATKESREKTRVVFKRHEIYKGDKVIIVEDVCNNFSTTKELIELVRESGGHVVKIACLVNRSPEKVFCVRTDTQSIPVVGLLEKAIAQYEQDDLRVIQDIRNGNVVWKPKAEWSRLMTAMATTSPKF